MYFETSIQHILTFDYLNLGCQLSKSRYDFLKPYFFPYWRDTVVVLSFSSYWTIESSWVWITTQSLSTHLLPSLSPHIQETHAITSTDPGSTESALLLVMEACSTAAWSVWFRTNQTPMWLTSHTASPSACRGHRVSKLATCTHVLHQSSASQALVRFVSHGP